MGACQRVGEGFCRQSSIKRSEQEAYSQGLPRAPLALRIWRKYQAERKKVRRGFSQPKIVLRCFKFPKNNCLNPLWPQNSTRRALRPQRSFSKNGHKSRRNPFSRRIEAGCKKHLSFRNPVRFSYWLPKWRWLLYPNHGDVRHWWWWKNWLCWIYLKCDKP